MIVKQGTHPSLIRVPVTIKTLDLTNLYIILRVSDNNFLVVKIAELPVIHHPPQETSGEVLQARENLMKAIQTFLRKFSRITFGEIPKVLLVAWERFSEIKHAFTDKQYQQEDIQELMHKLLEDVRNISEELAEYINSPSWNRPAFYFNDDYDEYTIIYRSTKVITHNLPTEEPKDPLIMGDEHLSTIPEKFDVLVCDDSPPLDVSEDNPMIFSNPLFDSNEDFTSSDDVSLSEEDVLKETFKIYSNPLFEFDDDFTSSDVNPLFNEVLEDVKSEDSFDSKLAEPTLLISPLSGANKDECFDPGGDEIDAFLDLDISTEIENDFHDSEGDIIFLEKLLINNTFPNLPSEVFLDHDPRSLKDEPNFVDMVQVFDPGIHEKSFSPTFVKLTFEDLHYFPITFVIRIFLS
ncbi:hypothetical protein Tco_1032466 [Tanacetum coccineum]|uniref:Reverse transcriptase domain-containing protein n=1 Tax=Tanacetum coccineum TaxID=301880 RepID=A0ABQ5GCG8_9ASTR